MAKTPFGPKSATAKPSPTAQRPKPRTNSKAAAKATGPPLKFPDLKVYFRWQGAIVPQGVAGPIGAEVGPITEAEAKVMLGWEDEIHYLRAMVEKFPDRPIEEMGFGDNYLTKMEVDTETGLVEGVKIHCWNNQKNRPFDLEHGRKLAQSILRRQWAGPLTLPGETINGETITISRTGEVESGQHRLFGLIWACHLWRKNRQKWEHLWPEAPVLESLVIKGVSNSPAVLQTLDNVKPRTLSDVWYTSDVFQGQSPEKKKELAGMLAAAVDLLWVRTQAGVSFGGAKVFQTHGESVDFFHRHKTLKEHLEAIFGLDKKRALGGIQITGGKCSTASYLMASASSDEEKYREMEEPSEKVMSFELSDKAELFWQMAAEDHTAADGSGWLSKALREAILPPISKDGQTTEGGRSENEKLVILARAWHLFQAWDRAEGGAFSADDITVKYPDDYVETSTGPKLNTFDERDDFGGIDRGMKKTEWKAPEPEYTEEQKEEMRKEKARISKERMDTARAKKAEREAAEAAKKGGDGTKPIPPATKVSPETQAVLDSKAAKRAAAAPSGTKTAPAKPIMTRKEVQAAQTAKAAAADEKLTKARAEAEAKAEAADAELEEEVLGDSTIGDEEGPVVEFDVSEVGTSEEEE